MYIPFFMSARVYDEKTIKIWYLLCISICLRHIEVNVLKCGSLGDLPVDGTDISIGVSASNVHLEVTNAAQEVVCVKVPG
jgi:hypothetical protein